MILFLETKEKCQETDNSIRRTLDNEGRHKESLNAKIV